jgi:hypothetical protein
MEVVECTYPSLKFMSRPRANGCYFTSRTEFAELYLSIAGANYYGRLFIVNNLVVPIQREKQGFRFEKIRRVKKEGLFIFL